MKDEWSDHERCCSGRKKWIQVAKLKFNSPDQSSPHLKRLSSLSVDTLFHLKSLFSCSAWALTRFQIHRGSTKQLTESGARETASGGRACQSSCSRHSCDSESGCRSYKNESVLRSGGSLWPSWAPGAGKEMRFLVDTMASQQLFRKEWESAVPKKGGFEIRIFWRNPQIKANFAQKFY